MNLYPVTSTENVLESGILGRQAGCVILSRFFVFALPAITSCAYFPQTLDSEAKEALAALDPQTTGLDEWLDHYSHSHLDHGCTMQLLGDGESSFQAMIELVDSTHEHLNVATWAFDSNMADYPPEAEDFADLLKTKVGQGVHVCLLVDPIAQRFWSQDTLLEQVREAGVEVGYYTATMNHRLFNRFLYRQHKKLIIADGRWAILGDVNFGVRYLGHEKWRSTNVLLSGPVVNTLQRDFLRDWQAIGGSLEAESLYLPVLPADGSLAVRVVDQRPAEDDFDLNTTVAATLRFARHRVDIEAPYFNPTAWLSEALLEAAARGVEIRILTNAADSQNQPFSYPATAYWFETLLAGGVRVFLWDRPDSTMHSKTMVVDDRLAMIGTYNFNVRSIMWDTEVAVFFNDPPAVEQVRQMTEGGFEQECVFEIDLDWLRAQPPSEQLSWEFIHLFGWLF